MRGRYKINIVALRRDGKIMVNPLPEEVLQKRGYAAGDRGNQGAGKAARLENTKAET
ncbi:MAG: hypothetical protein ACLUR9_03925 [Christensenellales bacterium]